ncbi:hypothetical protein TTHERM_00449610 (macronuclear) [Tetrahymena thermophila SB210]|uniref:Uncharacterized protein n=1 Tax=Tetrahymena thermophila (strain SB210) TaxID=312017 RepID=Q238V9_TETTS|nr:hypothetical protein TTHERM_00449610 [Tetrahymena thermophila SB210]EAR93111.1 hypothetical protein TTHERM_00449610 [Tetrahymena thermophila SB210]|eukprot:XP_001013356.1 hypothetical protein TTHERM_00449610 [Tetrahymena thermophila SB210]
MIRNSQSTLQMSVNPTNQLAQKRLLSKQNSQIIQKVKAVGERQDFSVCTIQLEQTIKPISFRQNSQNKYENSKMTSIQSQNSTPKNNDKVESRIYQQTGQRQFSLDQPKVTVIDLRSQTLLQKNDSYFTKESQRKLQQNSSNNLFRLRQNPNWFSQKSSAGSSKTEIISGKKELYKKLQEASTPTCRGANFEKSIFSNNSTLETLTKQRSEEKQQNFGQLCSQSIITNNQLKQDGNQASQINQNNNLQQSNNKSNIFSYINSNKQNYFQIAQKKNENLQIKLNQNQQSETFQQKLASKKQNNVNKISNIYQNEHNNLKNKNEEFKKLIINQYQQQHQLQQQNQQSKLSSQNFKLTFNYQQNEQSNKNSQKILRTSQSQTEFELPADHLKKDKEEAKKLSQNLSTSINEQQSQQNSCQQINSMTDHTVTQSVQRQKYFEIRSQNKELPKYQKQAKTFDQQQLLNITNIIEVDEPIQSSGKFNYISPIAKQKQQIISPKIKQAPPSSEQSYDQIMIWQSSEKSSQNTNERQIRNLEPITRTKINAEVQKREEFIKLYTKRFKNYPQQSPNSESLNDQQIENLVLDAFFHSSQKSSSSSQTSIKLENQTYKQIPLNALSTDSGNANLSTPKKKQIQLNEKQNDASIPYQVAMMQIDSSNSSNSVQGYLSKESTQIKQKINNVFFSDTKNHKQFIKSFFQETNYQI